MSSTNPRRGYVLGLTAYALWGIFPLYFKLLQAIPEQEVVAQRILSSAIFGLLLLLAWRHPGWLRDLLTHPRRIAVLMLSGSLIAANWLIYVWAVNHDRILEASLGYYINPLLNVLLGMLILRERLNRLQWVAIGLAALGVGVQLVQAGGLPWVSLSLALTFGLYGLIRKQAPIAALPGLAVEAWLLVPVSLGWLWLHADAMTMQATFWQTPTAWWLGASGLITLIPLICFNMAARHLPFSTLGFLQYVAPSLLMLIAVFVFDEPLAPSRLVTFGFIWAGLAVYTLDIQRRRQRDRRR